MTCGRCCLWSWFLYNWHTLCGYSNNIFTSSFQLNRMIIVVTIYNSIIAVVLNCYSCGDDISLTVVFAIVQNNSFCGIWRGTVCCGSVGCWWCYLRIQTKNKQKIMEELNAFQLVTEKQQQKIKKKLKEKQKCNIFMVFCFIFSASSLDWVHFIQTINGNDDCEWKYILLQ